MTAAWLASWCRLLLAGSANEAIEAIEDWEFPARLGMD
jgi:hypothetical protein